MHDSRPTVEDVARAALAAADTEVALILAEQWVTERYANIASRTPLRALHRTAELIVPAVVSAGAATVTAGAETVTGDATAQAAWSSDLVGRYIQLKTAWYRIAGVTSDVLQLEAPYAEDAVTAGSYRIVQRFHAVKDDVRTFGDFTLAQRRLGIRWMSAADLHYFAPYRTHLSFGPTVVVDHGLNAANVREVELYPYPQTAMQVSYDYWAHPPRLELTDPIPGSIDVHMLKEGVLIDLYRHLAARAVKTGDINAAGFWRNESRAQETRWEQFVNQALLNDRGKDDVETRMRSTLGGRHGLDIQTARDELWARGLHP